MADFEEHRSALDALDARIIALSTDPPDAARRTVESLGLGFEVLCGLDADATATQVGCYTGTHGGSRHVQPASFVLGPDGQIVHALYSSGKVGRLTGDDAVTLATDLQEQ